jgi:hypothetical protein
MAKFLWCNMLWGILYFEDNICKPCKEDRVCKIKINAPNELRIHVARGRQKEVAGERKVESARSMLNQAGSRHIIPVGLSQIPYGI